MRWSSNPTLLDRARSFSWPYPERAINRGPVRTELVAQAFGDLVAVHPWKADVKEDHVENFRGRRFDRGRAVVGHATATTPEVEDAGEALCRIDTIVDDQNIESVEGRLGREGWCHGASVRRRLNRGRRQSDREFTPQTSSGAFRGDAPAVQLNQTADERQPDSQPPLGTVEGLVFLGEEIENARRAFRRSFRCRCRAPG